MKPYTKPTRHTGKHSSAWAFSPQIGFPRGVFLVNHMTSTDNWTRTTKKHNKYYFKLTIQKGALISNNTMKNYPKTKIDRAWFSCLLHPARKWSGSILTTPEPARSHDFDNYFLCKCITTKHYCYQSFNKAKCWWHSLTLLFNLLWFYCLCQSVTNLSHALQMTKLLQRSSKLAKTEVFTCPLSDLAGSLKQVKNQTQEWWEFSKRPAF